MKKQESLQQTRSTQRSLSGPQLLWLSLALMLTIGGGLFYYLNVKQQERIVSRLHETEHKINSLNYFHLTLLRVVRNQRGYLYSGENYQVQKYNREKKETETQLNDLGKTWGEDYALNFIRPLQANLENFLTVLDRHISYSRDYPAADAKSRILAESAELRVVTEQTESLITVIRENLHRLSDSLENEELKLARRNKAGFVLLFFLILLLIFFIIRVWRKQLLTERALRREAERSREIMDSQQKKDQLINSAAHFIILLHTDGTVMHVNQTALDFTGLDMDQVKGKKMWECPCWNPGENNNVEFQNSIGEAAAGSRVSGETLMLNRDGREIPVLFSVRPQKDDSGQISSLVAEALPIEKIAKAREELRSQNRELEAFAGIAAHDLKEPLRMIGGFMELLQKKYGDKLDEKAKKYIGFAVNGSRRMSVLVNDLLDYARLSEANRKFSSFSLEELMEEILAFNDPVISSRGADIKWETALPVLTGDRTGIRLLFQNLLANALKFQPDDKQPRIQLTCKQESNFWHICVTDNGIGIAPEDKDHIFDLYHRGHVRDKFSGTGMGLATCKKVVELHAGRIWVESEQGKGSEFHILLPA